MIRASIAVAAALTAAVVLTAVALARPAATPTLTGTVGPGFTITLTMKGKKVTTLKAGRYKLVVDDKASIHAFSLDGPHGYAKDFTTVPFVGTKTLTPALAAGKYKYYCPPHESSMFGRFTVTRA
jgi:plastocyanin